MEDRVIHHSSLITHHSSLIQDEIDLNGTRDALAVHQPVHHDCRGAAHQLSDHHSLDQPDALQADPLGGDGVSPQVAKAVAAKAHHRADDPALFLRILLCLLVGLLLARFIGCDKSKEGGNSTLHVIIWDDTLSNSDQIRADDGQMRAVHDEAKKQIVDHIAAAAAQANSPQYCILIRLSELDQPRSFGRLNPTAVEDMRSYVAGFKPSLRHVNLADGLKAAKSQFETENTMRHVLHVVGDFRGVDWGERTKESLGQVFEELKTEGVETHLLDCVTPERTPQQKSPLASDNLAIVDFAPDARIVPRNKEIEFTVKVHNYSNSEKKGVFLRLRVNGQIREDGAVALASVPPNGETIAKITLGSGLDKGPGPEGEDAFPSDRFIVVSVHLEGEAGGIADDNVRYTVVEVRERVPILIVDNQPAQRGTKEAESFFLRKLFTEPIKGYDVQVKSASDLENLNLQPYSSIYICDVPKLTDAARKNSGRLCSRRRRRRLFHGPEHQIGHDQRVQRQTLSQGGRHLPGAAWQAGRHRRAGRQAHRRPHQAQLDVQ